MNEVKVFSNSEFGTVRTVIIDSEVWFVGIDVAKVLGYERPSKAILDNVSKDDVLTESIEDSLGRKQATKIINESGLSDFAL